MREIGKTKSILRNWHSRPNCQLVMTLIVYKLHIKPTQVMNDTSD